MFKFSRNVTTKINWIVILSWLPFCFYFLALNPYLAPETFDNFVYFESAKAIAETGKIQQGGIIDVGWPPALPMILAMIFKIISPTMFVAKIFILSTALGSLLLLFKLFDIEERPYKNLSIILFALSPYALLASSRIMTEWPFTFFSLAFLTLLYRLQEKRTIYLAIGTGLVLSMAIMTRYIGLALLTPILFCKKKERYEAIVFGIGLFIFIAWKWYSHPFGEVNENVFDFTPSWERFRHFDLIDLFFQFSTFTFKINYFSRTPDTLLPIVIGVFFGIVLFIGIYTMYKQRKFHLSDSYVFVTMLIILTYQWKLIRYILPIAPFLIIYFLVGMSKIIHKQALRKTFINVWIAFLIICDVALLSIGNMRTYNGLNYFVSPTEEQFYRGFWKDIFQASKFVREDRVPGAVLAVKIEPKYLSYFTGRAIEKSLNENYVAFVISKDSIDLNDFPLFHEIKQYGSIHVYKRSFL